MDSGDSHHTQTPSHLDSTPLVTMTPTDLPGKSDPTSANSTTATMSPALWQTPASAIRPHPATIREGFSSSCCSSEEYASLPAWDSSTLSLQQTPSDAMYSSRPVSMHQEFFTPSASDCGSWGGPRKAADESFDFPDMNIGQAYTADEAIPILDLRFNNHHPHQHPHNHPHQQPQDLSNPTDLTSKRISGSSFAPSTTGTFSDMPSYDDFSSALSEAPSLTSDYPPPSNRTSLLSSCTQLSPVASPRVAVTPGRSELVRTQSRGHASPSPRPSRSAPYNVDVGRNKRWSTGSYGTQNRSRAAPYNTYQPAAAPPDMFGPRMPGRPDGGIPLSYGNLQAAAAAAAQNPYNMMAGTAAVAPFRNSMLLPTQLPSHLSHGGFPAGPDMHAAHAIQAPPLMSHGLFRMLQSNGDPYGMHAHYGDLSDPPDLYSALNDEQIPPPPEDMNPSDPDLVPHEQELRFEGDLYTPRWVRGHGNKREGWCGICKPGRWLVLKNSAYWYDKSFTHGISATTGSPFQEPLETRRMDGNPDVWEGLCGSCNDWIALVSSKKKGTTWFRHAYKCHTHPKIKDAPKRRRESGQNRGLAASSMAKQQPVAKAEQSVTLPATQTQSHSHGQNQNGNTEAPLVPMVPGQYAQAASQQNVVPPPRPMGNFSRVLPPMVSEGAPPGMI